MARASPAIAAQNAGEFAPQMEGRTDIEKYAIASHIAQNFLSLKQGPATFRQGTAYVQPVKNSANRSWLRRFEFSQTQAFVLEFGDKYVRFYTNHGPLLATGVAAWNNSALYFIGSLVLQGGIIYYCVLANTNQLPPNATYWYPLTPYQGSPTTAIYEIPSPYAVADLTDSLGEFTLQIVQSGDVLYIAGGSAGTGPSGVGYPPYTLTRFANAPPNWSFSQYSPTDGPFASPVPIVPNQNIALSVSAVQGSAITITAWGGNLFAPTDVGRLVRIGSQYFNVTPWTFNVAWTAGQQCVNNGNNYTALNSANSAGAAPVQTSGAAFDGKGGVQWLYTDSGYGIAQITGYTDAQHVTAKVLTQFPANVVGVSQAITGITNANPAVVTVASAAALSAGTAAFITGVLGMTQVDGDAFTIGSSTATTCTLAGIDSTLYGTYTSGGTIIANASLEWQLGAWSNTTEWPRACAFFKDRLFWAGKLNVWGSVPGLYNSQAQDFFGQQTTDSALNELVSGSDASNITWLSPAIILLIGTQGGEYGLDAANYSTSPLGPSNVEILRQSNWRCRPIAPELVGTTVVYVQRAGRKIFAMDYNFYLNRYDSTDQSKFAYHITIGGLTSIAFMQEPWSILWGTRADGTLLSYTFNREDNVTAWNRQNLGGVSAFGGYGAVESLAVIPAPDGLRDELWMIVNRIVNGQTVRTVEYMVKHYEGPQAGYPGDTQSSCWYLDCAASVTQSGTTQISIPWLVGQTIGILADGGVQPQQVVPANGIVTLAGTFTTVTAGLPYQGNLVPMRPEGGADVGTAQGKLKQGANLVIRLVDSAGGIIGQLSNQNATTQLYQDPLGLPTQTLQNAENIAYNYTTTPLNSPPPLQSGDFPISFPMQANSDQDARDFYILVQQNSPLPMTVVGLYPSYKVEEPQ
jgi:hypothetical protein